MKQRANLLSLGALVFVGITLTGYLWYTEHSQKQQKLACSPKCNVILIIEDTLAASHLKTYGYKRDTMPQTTAFFEKNGVIFEQAHSVSPWTLPSFASMYFSDLANNITHKDLEQGTRTNLISLLRDTRAINIRAVVPPRGTLFIYDIIGKPFLEAEFVLPKNGDVFNPGIQTIKKLATENKAFFLVLHSLKIHDPYEPKSPYTSAFDSSTEYPSVSMQTLRNENAKPELPASTTEVFKLRYDQGILQEDAALAGFLNSLSPALLANTVVIFTSDHGEAFGEHGKYWHAMNLYQEELHVPLMIAGPNLKPRRVPDPVSGLDLAPTILSIMGAPIPSTLLGDDLTPLLFGSTLGERELQFVNGTPSYLDLSDGKEPPFINLKATGKEGSGEPLIIASQKGLRRGNLKAITRSQQGPIEFYDLSADPKEQTPITEVSKRISSSFLIAFINALYPSCGYNPGVLEKLCTKEQYK